MKAQFLRKIHSRQTIVGIIGLGYVGLPLLLAVNRSGFQALGFDLDPRKIELLKQGKSYFAHIGDEQIRELNDAARYEATTDFARLAQCDAIIICVPTPLNINREPDLSFVVNTAHEIKKHLRQGQLISLESTTYPGTMDDVITPILLEGTNWKVGRDLFIAFSPEREDPGNPDFSTYTIPKVVGGATKTCGDLAEALYAAIVERVVRVSGTKEAEMAKLLENIFRAVNIALVNEMKMVAERMGINIWEVIDAAKSKPFGFMPFYPGPGLGGHCIPIDPFYLTWKAREFKMTTRFIELAGEINTYMPEYVVERTMEALNEQGKALKGSKVLVLGVAYKKNIDDMRESPALEIFDLLRKRGAHISYNDPLILKLPMTRKHRINMKSQPLTEKLLAAQDVVLIATDHDAYDYPFIVAHSPLVVDTRNATKNVRRQRAKIVLA